jgi:hypothetical protein
MMIFQGGKGRLVTLSEAFRGFTNEPICEMNHNNNSNNSVA